RKQLPSACHLNVGRFDRANDRDIGGPSKKGMPDMRSLINRFKRDAQGTVALVAGLSAIPLVLVAGVALDAERAYHDRTALQAAVDGAGLALGASDLSDLDGLTTSQVATRMSQLTSMANKYIAANYT